ncbi:DUF1345 domain-containing protein [Pseudaminobacter arsenicus]|uniref:DUF1345 domain-containing protein n=1 Tax=Borborobacter arsenicus TaxID=1851146 RepID=A0A432VBE9_9HYPH|nr:DUF1345 domain-containing protein [Pseudaminobacter arsenicus]RUM99446.1 DUF1345 domain-containing protein [Pseudaminobacter arsenicus]
MKKLVQHRHFPFAAGAVLGLAAFVPAFLAVPRLAVVIAADLFFAAYLILTLIRVPDLTASYLKKHAESADEPIGIIFAVTLLTICVATASLFIILNGKPAVGVLSLVIAGIAVPLGWLTIHMMAALHYARLYWRPATSSDGRASGKPGRGLEFPGGGEPDAADFLYFSYVVGMTAQTSDVAITSAQMRRINLIHAIVSFFFNTVIVAAAVNVAVSFGD